MGDGSDSDPWSEGTDEIIENALGAKSESLWSQDYVMILGSTTLVFGLVVLLIVAYLLAKQKDIKGDTVLKVVGLVTIATFSAFLVVVGYGREQLTPIIGLFGAIAGYLLGKDSNGTPEREL